MKSLLNLKRFHIGKHERYLIGIIILATLLRFILIYFNWPSTNSDETTMGLMSRHIAYNGEWPIFYYGQSYMGPIEAYLAAPLFHLLGSSLFTLRLELLLFFALFLLGMYALTALLHTQKLGLFICLLFSFGATPILLRQLKAIGGYPETEFFAVTICVITIWLALYAYKIDTFKRTNGRRIFIYGVLGLIIGLSIWEDMLILPFVCMGILFLLLFCRRECFSWAGVALVLGTLIGLMPLIIYNVSVPLDQNAIVVLVQLHNGGTNAHATLWQQLVGTFGIALPGALGYNSGCTQSQFPYFGQTVVSCVVTHFGWSIGYLILWSIAAFMSGRAVWKLWRARQGMSLWHPEWTFEQSRQLIIECGRLMVLICAIGTLFLFVSSSASALTPGPTSRYLICILISMPVILWPLWDGLSLLLLKLKAKEIIVLVVRTLVLGLIFFVYVSGTIDIFVKEVPQAQFDYQREQQTVQSLEHMHLKYVYSEYWTCNNIIFISNENIICAVVNAQLKDGYNRYPAYATEVKKATRVAYIFPLGSDLDKNFVKMVNLHQLPVAYQILRIPGYHIFTPR
ncbi:hypothetical protein [Dictyobacter formicarum]|uniref:Glycosyltransferase RgtA/B/C/D-like domain-containing protein n=1 Tax=Dictyobacter formicarum TaxID=2778368 RepID=A0ABQ3VL04_9CHLR|nr:hypothetical protein [Dictyobacter formicarum]GHO86288.1 hypothetical protein KSZ_42940 [Dictyobacter formicarum]